MSMQIRNKPKRSTMWLYFTMIVFFEIFITVIAATSSTAAIVRNPSLTKHIPGSVWTLMVGVVVGIIVSLIVNRIIFIPVSKLSGTMRTVARGDFTVNLHTKSMVGEMQELYDNFNLMVRELRATEILQTDFVSNVSHEFKTPINAIEGYAMLLQDPSLSEEERQTYTSKILSNTCRLSELVSNILLLSKVDNQAISKEEKTFSLDEQIRQAILALESRWEPKEIAFDVRLQNISFTANESLLLHVWTNLIDNAVKFSPNGGNILLRLQKSSGKIRFCIEDEGPGIPEEAQKHIFDKFYQSDSSHKGEGNGLGLALVKRILDTCDGTVFAENTETGCRFTVELPG